MKQYHVYGIGNALVDYEFSIDDAALTAIDVAKGVMTLVDRERQDFLISRLGGQEHKRACGGSAANTIIGVAQFGGKAYYSCRVANDESGDFYYKDLKSHGVDTNLGLANRPEGVTGKCLVLVTPDAERTMNTYLGITAELCCDEVEPDAISRSEYLYMEGYLSASPSGKLAVLEAKKIAQQHGVKTALTFSDPNMVQFFGAVLQEFVGDGIDMLFCNDKEALLYTKTDTVAGAAEQLKKIATNFAITMGAHGAVIWDGTTLHKIPAFPVKAVDTNGAGDIFAGAYLYAITHGYTQVQAGTFASLAASRLVTRFGPRLGGADVVEVLRQLSAR